MLSKLITQKNTVGFFPQIYELSLQTFTVHFSTLKIISVISLCMSAYYLFMSGIPFRKTTLFFQLLVYLI